MIHSAQPAVLLGASTAGAHGGNVLLSFYSDKNPITDNESAFSINAPREQGEI